MTTMTTLPFQAEWTVEDLDRLPDDGLQHELLDGILLVSPAPVPRHQMAVVRLLSLLDRLRPAGVTVFVAPLDWRPDEQTSLQPDVLAVHTSDIGELNISRQLLLAVEVLSPSTRRKDQLLKFSKYQECGVGSYWIVDPGEPSITAWDLVDGSYLKIGHATGDTSITLQNPYPVTVVPSALVTF